MGKPFVKLFRTPNAGYCLDINRNEILKIGEDSYDYLRAVLSGKAADKEPEELQQLKEQGYLLEESVVKKVKHPISDYLEEYLDRRLNKLTLQVTQDCNFRCRYCVYSEEHNDRQRSHSKKHLSLEDAKRAVDFLWEHSVDSSNVNIGFYGGEPLLEMELIREIIAYSEKRFAGKELTYNITTNATLLTEEIVHYFQDHKVRVMISLDGPKEINDRNRVFKGGAGTFDTVMERIAMVRRTAPEYAHTLQISMVMDPENDFDCINEIYIEENQFDELNVSTSIVDQEYDGREANFSEAYIWKNRYHRFLALLSYMGRIERRKLSPIVNVPVFAEVERRMDVASGLRLFAVDAPSGPCIPGQLRLFCNAEGRLFPCERVSETSDVCCIGSLENGFDLEKARAFLNVGAITEEDCKRCWSFRYCSLCGKKADAGNGRLEAEEKRRFCAQVRGQAEAKIKLYLLFQEIPGYYGAQASVL